MLIGLEALLRTRTSQGVLSPIQLDNSALSNQTLEKLSRPLDVVRRSHLKR
jgi:hypothetical protein